MKKFLSVIFTVTLLLSLSACRKSGVFETSSDHPVVPGGIPSGLTDYADVSTDDTSSAPEESSAEEASGASASNVGTVAAQKKEPEKADSSGPAAAETHSAVSTPAENTVSQPVAERSTTSKETPIALIRDGFLKLVNEERARVGVGPLSYDTALQSAANVRAGEIIVLFDHTRPDGSSCFTAVDSSKFTGTAMGENIGQMVDSRIGAGSSDSALNLTDEQISALCSAMFEQFKNSPGHYDNIIKAEFSMTGIGVDYKLRSGTDIPEFYFAHMFGG